MGGSSVYLVTACASGEEFVAAFRRYADKGGIFIPIAEPLPANRRGRIALTLTDGGVMIEGEAEVVASSKSPSPLYGRVGMTIRFVEPDDASRITLGELDKARLAPKPPVPSIPPRPADVPATPRPVPPPASGRIDAANALAETVAIGDLALLKDLGPPKAGPKFVIPSIPSSPLPRAKTPSAFPIVEARTRAPSAFPIVEAPKSSSGPIPSLPSESRSPAPFSTGPSEFRTKSQTAPPPVRAKTGTMPPPSSRDTQPIAVAPPPKLDPNDRRAESRTSLPPLEALKVGSTQAVAVVPPPQFTSKNLFPEADAIDTDTSRAAPESAPPERMGVRTQTHLALNRAPSVAGDEDFAIELDSAPPPAPGTPAPIDVEDSKRLPALTPTSVTTVAAPPTRTPTTVTAQPAPASPDPATSLAALVRAAAQTKKSRGEANPTLRGTPGKVPSFGATPADGVPASPIVAVRPPVVPAMEADEPTDLTEIADLRSTSIGLSVPPLRDTLMMAAAEEDPSDLLPTTRAAALPAKPHIEEPTPSGDWTMTPDGPVQTPADKASAASDDWTITPDMATPEGWDSPENLVKADPVTPAPVRVKPLGPSRTKVIQAVAVAPEPERIAEPKVQIDPTLMEPLVPMPAFDDDSVAPPPPLRPMQPSPLSIPTPMPMSMPAQSQHGMMAAPQFVAQSHHPSSDVGIKIGTPLPFAPPPQLAAATGSTSTYPGDSNQQMARLGFSPQRVVTDGGTGFFREENAPNVRYPTDPTSVLDIGRRRRLVIIAVSAATVVAIGLVILFMVVGRKKSDDTKVPDRGSGSAGSAVTGAIQTPSTGSATETGSAVEAVVPTVPDDAGTPAVVAPIDAAVAPVATDCGIDITTAPSSVEILDDTNKVIGTSPTKLTLPCSPTKLIFRKPSYVSATRTVTATPGIAKLRVGLAHQSLSVKVSSSPPGASISIDGKAKGVTPTTVKLPMLESSTITFKRDGFQGETAKVTPRTNNQSVHVTLKKKGR